MSTLLTISNPYISQLPQLRSLWKEAFGDSDAFLDTFFTTAFSLQRCRCITIEKKIVAALYWFDCIFQEKPIAYIYAVATAKSHQGQGLCHALMQNTHEYLASYGYVGAVLVPGSKELFTFYEKIGYQTCCYIDELHYTVPNAFSEPVRTFDGLQSEAEKQSNLKSNSLSVISNSVRTSFENTNFQLCLISAEKFSHLRKQFLPPNSILQENENLDFLETQAQFYQGNNFLLTASKQEDTLYGLELLGNTSAIPQILQTFECKSGTFRVPKCKSTEMDFGENHVVLCTTNSFAMYFPLKKNIELPSYFGFAFD